jgi:gliding motility-associated-like protein
MKKLILYISLLCYPVLWAQNYLMSNVPVTSCAGTFYDTGGASGNYYNNHLLTKTFSSGTPGMSLRMNFSLFDLEEGKDFMYIFDGENDSASILGIYTGGNNPGIVQATPANSSGSLTIRFVSNKDVTASGWIATISCVPPGTAYCQEITPFLASSEPAIDSEGIIRICQGVPAIFNGGAVFSESGNDATYEWYFDNGNTATGQSATTFFTDPGIYKVSLNVTDANGCNSVLGIRVYVSQYPDFEFTDSDQVCFGTPSLIAASLEPLVSINECAYESLFPVFIPEYSYINTDANLQTDHSIAVSQIEIDCFAPGQLLTNVSQLDSICATIEAESADSINITLISPNGQRVDLLSAFEIWQDDGVYAEYLGFPWDGAPGLQLPGDSPGFGEDYCFSLSATAFLANAPTILIGEPGIGIPLQIAPGTYLPSENFGSLLGSPLNGVWSLEITNYGYFDNGYVFNWNLNFDPAIFPAFTPEIVSEGWLPDPSIIAADGNIIMINPDTPGEHCFTYTATDNFGCTYTQTKCIEVLEPMDLGEPQEIYNCGGTFDLTQNIPLILDGANANAYSFQFHHSFQEALDLAEPIDFPQQYNASDEEVVYVSIEDLNSVLGCIEVKSFVLHQGSANAAVTQDGAGVCQNEPFQFTFTGSSGEAPYTFTFLLDGEQGTVITAFGNSVSINIPTNVMGEHVLEMVSVESESCTNLLDDVYTVNVAPRPEASIIIDNSIICRPLVTFTGSGGTAPYTFSYSIGTEDHTVSTTFGNSVIIDLPVGELGEVTVGITGVSDMYCSNVQDDIQLITVYELPYIPQLSPYRQCDENNPGDGVEIFDLTSKIDEITNNTTGLAVIFFTSIEAAENGDPDGAVTVPSAFIIAAPDLGEVNNMQQIWVRVTNTFGCSTISSFTIAVDPLPVINPVLQPFYQCEEVEPGQAYFDLDAINAVMVDGHTGVILDFYPTFEGAQTGGDDTLSQLHLTATATIYVRVEGITGCTIVIPVQLEVLSAPVAAPPAPLEECDPSNDNVTVFNLEPVLAQIEAQLDNTVSAIPFETYDDAFFAAMNNDIENTSAYTNVEAFTTNGVQMLYIRVDSDQTDCFDVVELQLIVHPVPVATEPEPYALCDNGTSDTDGIANFDLTALEEEILGTLNPAQYSVAFFDTEEGAINNIGAIPTPASYDSPSVIIFARITNNATGCKDVIELELIVNPLPLANDPTPYTLCDINASGDEIEVFDLTTKIEEIIGLQDGINTTFFHDYDDALAGTGASQIMTPETYTNTEAVEAIFVRVELEETGCFRIVLLDVRVQPVPVLIPPTDDELTVCDTTGLGYGVFDLAALVEDMVNNGPNLEVTFHLTSQDAIDGNNPITVDLANYHNVDPFIQFVYVRVVNTVTGCTTLQPYLLSLRVEPAPQAPEDLEDLVQCDEQDNNGQNGQAFFDLTIQDPIIHTALGIDATTLTIHYFTSEANANNGAPRITNPSQYNGTNGQTIWVRVETPDTECFSVTSFQLELHQPLLLTTPTILALCNESLPNDAQAVFDLTVKDEEILGEFGVGHGNIVTYFEIDPRVDPTALPVDDATAYTNPAPPMGSPKTLYVMVTTPEGCKSYTTLTIKVLPLPVPDTTPDVLVKCDVNGSPDGQEVFDLTDAAADIRNGDTTMVLTYYTTEEDANNRENQIPNITNYTSGSATIWVRAEANTQDPINPVCFQVVSFELIVNPLPVLGNAGVIEPYAICEQNTDGIATFDFNTHMDEILGAGVEPAHFTVTFYRDAAAQGLGTAMPYIYMNSNPLYHYQQNILVEVRHNETECIITAPLTLLVEEAAIANLVTETFFECDYDGTNDGIFTFDLTRADDDALGTQNPTDYSVSYYTTLEDAEAGTNAIANLTAYNNTPDYQMIWVRVTNESTVSGCNNITTLELFVERIPEPALDADHTTLCTNFDIAANERDVTIDTGLDATHTFVWYKDTVEITGQTGPTLTVTEEGSYTVVATSAPGCVSGPIAPIVIKRSGSASPIGSGYVVGNPFGENQIITVLVQGYGEYQFKLDDGSWQNSNVFENVSAYSQHIVYVRDIATADPCDDVELILGLEGVSVIDYPNFFTPNGDGYNDYWKPFGLSNQSAVVYIFDRYGKLLKQISTNPEGLGWDGTYNGQPMPGDDYWFTIEYTIGDERRGFKSHFALKR